MWCYVPMRLSAIGRHGIPSQTKLLKDKHVTAHMRQVLRIIYAHVQWGLFVSTNGMGRISSRIKYPRYNPSHVRHIWCSNFAHRLFFLKSQTHIHGVAKHGAPSQSKSISSHGKIAPPQQTCFMSSHNKLTFQSSGPILISGCSLNVSLRFISTLHQCVA